MRRRVIVLGLPRAAGLYPATHAQSTPASSARPVRIVVPYPAGGPVDAAARQLARGMAVQTGETVIVENKPSAGRTLGAAEVARSAPDGHTLLLALPDALTYVPQRFKRLPYDPTKRIRAAAGSRRRCRRWSSRGGSRCSMPRACSPRWPRPGAAWSRSGKAPICCISSRPATT